MKYTDIYPVFEKLKENEHVIFRDSGLTTVNKEDYQTLDTSLLIDKINRDIEMLFEMATDKKYVRVDAPKEVSLTSVQPSKDTYLMVVTFQGFKYMFVKSKELCILINYVAENLKLGTDSGDSWDFLPKEGKSRRTVMSLNKSYAKFSVNTYSAFCGYCQIHLNVSSNQLFFKYNRNFHQVLGMLLKQIEFPDGEKDKTVQCTVQGKNVYVRFVNVYNLIIVVEWTEGI